MLSPSLVEKGQENQEEVIQHNQSESEEMSQFAYDFILEEIISRYGAGKNYNIMNKDRLEVLSRANELSRRVSVDLLQNVDDLANRAFLVNLLCSQLQTTLNDIELMNWISQRPLQAADFLYCLYCLICISRNYV